MSGRVAKDALFDGVGHGRASAGERAARRDHFAAGALSDRYGRKPVLVAGWAAGLPVPLLLIWAPSWGWMVFANVLLGINQGWPGPPP